MLKIANELANKYPEKPIYLYGADPHNRNEIFSAKNLYCLGSLSLQETAGLYNKCELGIVQSIK